MPPSLACLLWNPAGLSQPGNGLTIGPRIDAPVPLFVTEPDAEDELVDEFIDPRSGAKVDAKTGEIL